jgi:hypothetical protein
MDREFIMQFFKYDHLPAEKQAVSKPFGELAEVIHQLPRNPERSVALRKLLEAKDAAVRASFAAVLLVLCFVGTPAFAVGEAPIFVAPQVTAPGPSTVGQQVVSFVLQYIVVPLLPIVGGLLAFALKKWADSLAEAGKTSASARIGSKLMGAAESAVAEINATLRPQLEAALADGVLTDVEKAALKKAAMDLLMTKLPKELLAAAGGIFGDFLPTYLSGLLERSLLNQKATAAIAAGPAAPVPQPA